MYSHLNGSAVRYDSGLDVETLVLVSVGVELVDTSTWATGTTRTSTRRTTAEDALHSGIEAVVV